MKPKVVLCAAVLGSFAAAGCSKTDTRLATTSPGSPVVDFRLYDGETGQPLSNVAVSIYDGFDKRLPPFGGPARADNAPYHFGDLTTSAEGLVRLDLQRLRHDTVLMKTGRLYKYIRRGPGKVKVLNYRREGFSLRVTAHYDYDLDSRLLTITRFPGKESEEARSFSHVDVRMDREPVQRQAGSTAAAGAEGRGAAVPAEENDEISIPASSVRFLLVAPDGEKRSGLYAIKTPPPKRPISWPWEFRRAADGTARPPRAGLPVTLVGKLPGRVTHLDYFEGQPGSVKDGRIELPARYVLYTGDIEDLPAPRHVYVVADTPLLRPGKYRARITFEEYEYLDRRNRSKIKRRPPTEPPRFLPLVCEIEIAAKGGAADPTE